MSLGIVKSQTLNESDLLNYISFNSSDTQSSLVIQAGNQNLASIEGTGVSLTQTGNNQSFYYTETSILPSNLQINMQGENNYVEIFGNNQVLDNVTINISGDNRNITIRNYP